MLRRATLPCSLAIALLACSACSRLSQARAESVHAPVSYAALPAAAPAAILASGTFDALTSGRVSITRAQGGSATYPVTAATAYVAMTEPGALAGLRSGAAVALIAAPGSTTVRTVFFDQHPFAIPLPQQLNGRVTRPLQNGMIVATGRGRQLTILLGADTRYRAVGLPLASRPPIHPHERVSVTYEYLTTGPRLAELVSLGST